MTLSTRATKVATDALIGERVHQLMWRSKISQTQFSGELGMTQTSLSRKLRGTRPWNSEELVIIADKFGVTMDHLYGRDDRPTGGLAPDDSGSRLRESNPRPSHYE